jgi:hypothetical protein
VRPDALRRSKTRSLAQAAGFTVAERAAAIISRMKASAFWKAVLVDRGNLLDRVLAFLRESGLRYCVIGGTGVNAHASSVRPSASPRAFASRISLAGPISSSITCAASIARFWYRRTSNDSVTQ